MPVEEQWTYHPPGEVDPKNYNWGKNIEAYRLFYVLRQLHKQPIIAKLNQKALPLVVPPQGIPCIFEFLFV